MVHAPSGQASSPDPAVSEPRSGQRSGDVGAIVVNLILLYVVHHLLVWGVPFLTPTFTDVLWAVDLSLEATIVARVAFLIYPAWWFRSLGQIGLTGIAFIATRVMYDRFPFDFGSPAGNQLAHLALFLVLVALVIAAVVQIVVLLVGPAQRGGKHSSERR
jgi:hypothetical protein